MDPENFKKASSTNRDSLKDFVDFIKKQTPKTRGGSKIGGFQNEHYRGRLIEMNSQGMFLSQGPYCFLENNKLIFGDKSRLLSEAEMNKLYQYILPKYLNNEFIHHPSFNDIRVMDATSFSLDVNWGEISFRLSAVHTIPKCVAELEDQLMKYFN